MEVDQSTKEFNNVEHPLKAKERTTKKNEKGNFPASSAAKFPIVLVEWGRKTTRSSG